MAHVWPQITWLALMGMGLGLHLAKHGQSRSDEHYNIVLQLLGTALVAFVLWSGGFFAPIGLG